MMKIAYSEDKIDNFGGLILFSRFKQRIHFGKTVEQLLGKRVAQARYSNADIIASHTYCALSGGQFTEDINKLRKRLPGNVYKDICSTDTFQEQLKQLSLLGERYILRTETNRAHEFCFHQPLNKILSEYGQRVLENQESQSIFLDHDHTKVLAKKRDTAYCYKGQGYYISCFSIANTPLFISTQGGNTPPKAELMEPLGQGLAHLAQRHLCQEKIFRADGACYNEEIVELANKHCRGFLIRSMTCASRAELLRKHGQIVKEKGKPGYKIYSYTDSFGKVPVRRILYLPLDAIEEDLFPCKNYSELITSIEDKDASVLIQCYNQRGQSEQLFDELKNDYNMAHPPFSDLQYNTAYFICCALSCVLIKLFKAWLCTKVSGIIPLCARIKRLTFRLISIPAKLVRHARYQRYKLYTKDKRLQKLIRILG